MSIETDNPVSALDEQFALDEAQVNYFRTFGYLKLPGLFRDDIDRITAGFERVFEASDNPRWETYEALHFSERRLIIPQFIDKDPELAALKVDPRVVGTVTSLIPQGWEYAESDGNIFSCDSSWHCDVFGAALERAHLKLSFYLDPLSEDSGAIRIVPGTNHYLAPYARAVRRSIDPPDAIIDRLGVEPADLPSLVISSEPGDLIIWDFRTVHGSFNGGERRRLFSVNFRETLPEED